MKSRETFRGCYMPKPQGTRNSMILSVFVYGHYIISTADVTADRRTDIVDWYVWFGGKIISVLSQFSDLFAISRDLLHFMSHLFS